MSADPVCFRVALAESPAGLINRIVIYDWFARGEGRPPPRGGHAVELLVDGERAWARVAGDLEAARETILLSTWKLRPDIELLRPPELGVSEPPARRQLRLGELLERRAAAGVHVRLLIWGFVYTPILDPWLLRWFWRGPDAIEVLEQDHPNLFGSLHQKTITIDGRVGYCGGMNLEEKDWDTAAHAIYEPRRNPHLSSRRRRAQTAERRRRPVYMPRHDLMLRLEGPAVADLERSFVARWQSSVRAKQRAYLGRAVNWLRRQLGSPGYPTLEPPADLPAPRGEHWVQVVRTTPGGEEDGILGAYIRAIRNARRYIYIENQYFRSAVIAEALSEALRRNPALRLIIVVRPINEGDKSLFNPASYWTAHALEVIRAVRPEFELTRLIVWARDADRRLVWQNVHVHAKLMIVDDVWVTIGSANINDRGFHSDGELNIVLLDKPLARDLRRRLMAEHLELEPSDERLAAVDDAFDLWEQHARINRELRERGREAISRVHHFVQAGLPWPPFGIGSEVV